MNVARVEGICSHLSSLFMKTIRIKILDLQEPLSTYSFGEALTFWLADNLISTKLVQTDQMREILEEFGDRLLGFGVALEQAWVRGTKELRKLPLCKIGILDRRLICMDGVPFFFDIVTGQKKPATDDWPLETVVYNLTTLFVMYYNKSKESSSDELGGTDARS